MNIKRLPKSDWPKRLCEIPQPPKTLYMKGEFPKTKNLKWLTVVGSREPSHYAERICRKLISGLKGHPVVVVSGLAYGIDSMCHNYALAAGLKTVAVPGSGLDDSVIYPQVHLSLANKIVESGGCLLSEFSEKKHAEGWMFPMRNRVMVGLSHAVLIIEGKQKSGTMISARLGTEYNRDVMTVPGSIFSVNSEGPNSLLSLGATPVTDSEDILHTLGLINE